MTRKRFIKLMMSMGYQRNRAEALAILALNPYKDEIKYFHVCGDEWRRKKNHDEKKIYKIDDGKRRISE